MRHRKTELFVLIASAAMGAWFGLAMEENHQRQVAGLYSAAAPSNAAPLRLPLTMVCTPPTQRPQRKDIA